MKKCSKCNLLKSEEEFGKHRRNRDGLNTECKQCNKERATLWQKNNKEKINKKCREWNMANPEKRKEISKRDNDKRKRKKKNSYLLKTYGITIEQYDQLFDEQDGICKICSKPESNLDKRTGLPVMLAVDHDHTTGKIRGLLCANCNMALGLLNDSANLFKKAAHYLEK